MLVSLATNQTIAANSSATYTYSPQSVQKVFVSVEDADWEAGNVTVQIGSRTICNGINNFGLKLITNLKNNAQSTASKSSVIELDFGSHQCMNNENLYVTIQAVAEMSATDVSAIVDEPFSGSLPVRLTEYSDTTFTAENVLGALSYDSAMAEVNEDAYNCEIKTSLYSSAPSFISANSYFQANTLSNKDITSAGLLCKHQLPLKTTFNYSSSAVTDRIITSEVMGSTNAEIAKGRRTARIAKAAAR
ncbi:MAG: hypothetical protein [Circular genetic element sp.]|nr:MAG: hypothetical protein [Circular genetic element sp.]